MEERERVGEQDSSDFYMDHEFCGVVTNPGEVSDIAAGLIDSLMVAYHAIHQATDCKRLQHAFERLTSKINPILKIVVKP